MLDDFREWLSDYLRYFMLGGAILLVLLIVIFGVKACSGHKNKQNKKNETQTQEEQKTPSSTEDKEEKEEEVEAVANPLVEAEEDLTKLIEDYYKALGEKDIETLSTLVNDLSPSDESKITNASDYIERYQVNKVYTKTGMDEHSYVVYADYSYYCQGIDVAVPALSQLYAVQEDDGAFKINGAAETDSEIKKYTKELRSDEDVKKLSSGIKADYSAILDENPDLKDFLEGLGKEEESSSKASTGTMLRANDVCNVREAPGGDVIGGLDYGTEVEKLGEEDGWIMIEYEGQNAYVYASLLDEIE